MSIEFNSININALATRLLNCETEKEVERVLEESNLLDDQLWRPLGGSPTNYSVAGNQQASSVASLVEKLVNSIDAVLLDECYRQGLDPRSSDAPKNMRQAVERFFDIPEGRLENASSKRRSELSHKIHLIATGKGNKNPCYTIVDVGEGQTPRKIPNTILSLPGAESESNKTNINFVQGLFNMGGTGVLRFCGKNSYCQLVISRRDPFLIKDKNDAKSCLWALTIVRRKYPKVLRESSVYEYLAPNGEILTFKADSIPAIPGVYPAKFQEPLYWGTCIKLYEYEMPRGLASHAVLDLNYELNRYFHEMALPIRISERRERGREKEFSGSHSYEGILAGMAVRLGEKPNELLVEGYPAEVFMHIEEIGRISIKIYAFSTKLEKKTLKRYVGDKAIIFTLNGQMHGNFKKNFFNRRDLNLSHLQEYLLIVVDCSLINPRAREDLFMNSRDRLAETRGRRILETELISVLSQHEGLQSLEEKIREEAYRQQYQDNKPLKDVLQKLIKTSPSIANLFSKGFEIIKESGFQYRKIEGKYVGKRFPTFFRLQGGRQEAKYDCPINSYCVISYETDVKNDYFRRGRDRGQFMISDRAKNEMMKSYHLWNGILRLRIKPPHSAQVGETFTIETYVKDRTQKEAFKSKINIKITTPVIKNPKKDPITPPPSPPPPKEFTRVKVDTNDGTDEESKLRLPTPIWVEQDDENWIRYEFTETTALKMYQGDKGLDIFINKDNLYLKKEISFHRNMPAEFLREQYKCGMVLACLGLYQSFLKKISNHSDQNDEGMKEENIPELVNGGCDALAQVILPIISIGNIDKMKSAKIQEITVSN